MKIEPFLPQCHMCKLSVSLSVSSAPVVHWTFGGNKTNHAWITFIDQYKSDTHANAEILKANSPFLRNHAAENYANRLMTKYRLYSGATQRMAIVVFESSLLFIQEQCVHACTCIPPKRAGGLLKLYSIECPKPGV